MTSSLRVWATRPSRQNIAWSQSLSEQGFEVVNLPLLAIAPVSEPKAVQAVKNTILAFDEFEKVIFVSQNAVQETFSWLSDYWPQLPIKQQYFAVGKKTADLVVEQGVEVVSCVTAMNSDELLVMGDLQEVKHQKILICRGVGGLPRLGEELKARGAVVHYCELYTRLLPDGAVEKSAQPLGVLSDKDVVVLFSGETLQNFVTVLIGNGIQERSMHIVVPGDRVAKLAQSLDFSKVTVASNASSDSMLQTVVSLL